jgi:hypothetical protein
VPEFQLPGPQLPLLGDQKSSVTLTIPGNVTDTLGTSNDTVAAAKFDAGGNAPVRFTGGGDWKVTASVDTQASISIVRPNSDAAKGLDLGSYFVGEHQNDVELVLSFGAQADGAFTGKFKYSPLMAAADLKLGSNLSFRYAHPYGRDTKVLEAAKQLLVDARLPGALTDGPAPGEVIEFGYGGYLQFGASLSAGYKLSGSTSIDVGPSHLSSLRVADSYKVTAAATLSVGAKVAGLFTIQVRRDDQPTTGRWIRVVAKKNKSGQFSFAADVSVKASNELKGLPDSPNEFLAALLGVNAKGWVNAIQHVAEYTDWEKLEAALDGLTKQFISRLLDTAFDDLKGTPIATVQAQISKYATAYNNADQVVLDVFERYYHKLKDPTLGPEIASALERIKGLKSWGDLKGDVPAPVWSLVNQFTDGDPLGWVVDKSVAELQRRAAGVLDLAHSVGRSEISAVIGLVKSELGLDPLMNAVEAITTPDELKDKASSYVGTFVNRLVGEVQANSDINDLFRRVHEVSANIDDVETKLYAQFKQVLTNTYGFNLHAAYTRSSESAALVDVSFDLETANGRQLYDAAIGGNFEGALASYRDSAVKINHGELTHTSSRETSLDINVIGWHDGLKYHGIETLVAKTSQQIAGNDGQISGNDRGGLTVFTQIDVTDDTERRFQGQRVATHFLLHLAGQSTGVLTLDKATHDYLVNTISKMQAGYTFTFGAVVASQSDIQFALSFARAVGITSQAGFDVGTIANLLSSSNGPTKNLSAIYDTRYEGGAVQQLFTRPTPEAVVRTILRQVVLGKLLTEGPNQAAIGWAYWTDAVYRGWLTATAKNVSAFIAGDDAQVFSPIANTPFAGQAQPGSVTLSRDQRSTVDALYRIENSSVKALQALHAEISSPTPIPTAALEDALLHFEQALSDVRNFTRNTNGVFALFDGLVRMYSPTSRKSSLTIKATVDDQHVSMAFVSI